MVLRATMRGPTIVPMELTVIIAVVTQVIVILQGLAVAVGAAQATMVSMPRTVGPIARVVSARIINVMP